MIDTMHYFILKALFPVMLFLYQRVINYLADMGKLQANVTAGSVTTINFDEWYSQILFLLSVFITFLFHSFIVPNNGTETESPHGALLEIVKYYVLLGFVSIVCYWIAWASWIMAAERQVRRIRFVIICINEKIFESVVFLIQN